MPVYEYECDTCGFVVEEFLPVIPREVPLQIRGACRNCGETDGTFKKVISLTEFQLKGGRWAKDGYSNDSQDGSKVVSITEPK